VKNEYKNVKFDNYKTPLHLKILLHDEGNALSFVANGVQKNQENLTT